MQVYYEDGLNRIQKAKLETKTFLGGVYSQTVYLSSSRYSPPQIVLSPQVVLSRRDYFSSLCLLPGNVSSANIESFVQNA